MRRVFGVAVIGTVVLAAAGCSGGAPADIPAALDGVCGTERGCELSTPVNIELCAELGGPERIAIYMDGVDVESVKAFMTYPTFPSYPFYPTAESEYDGWTYMVDCTRI